MASGHNVTETMRPWFTQTPGKRVCHLPRKKLEDAAARSWRTIRKIRYNFQNKQQSKTLNLILRSSYISLAIFFAIVNIGTLCYDASCSANRNNEATKESAHYGQLFTSAVRRNYFICINSGSRYVRIDMLQWNSK